MTALQTTPQAPMTPRPVPTRRTNLAQQSWIMVKRNMIHTKRMPEMLSDVTAQPIMFVLLFAFVFGASITNTGGASYREFLLPGIQAQTIVFSAFVVAAGITADVEKGIIDRFRALLPAAFYYKTFQWPSWHFWEPLVRRAAVCVNWRVWRRYASKFARVAHIHVQINPLPSPQSDLSHC